MSGSISFKPQKLLSSETIVNTCWFRVSGREDGSFKPLKDRMNVSMRSVFNAHHYLHRPAKMVIIFPQGLNLWSTDLAHLPRTAFGSAFSCPTVSLSRFQSHALCVYATLKYEYTVFGSSRLLKIPLVKLGDVSEFRILESLFTCAAFYTLLSTWSRRRECWHPFCMSLCWNVIA
jgi:hypothetical protein